MVEPFLDVGEPIYRQRRRLQHPCRSPGTRFPLCAGPSETCCMQDCTDYSGKWHSAGTAGGHPGPWRCADTFGQVHACGWAYHDGWSLPRPYGGTRPGGSTSPLCRLRAGGRPCSGRAPEATGGLAGDPGVSRRFGSHIGVRIRTSVRIAYARMCPVTTFVH